MRNRLFAYAKCANKESDADQLRDNREADQRLCFRYIHTVQPDSFSTVGAFSTVATVLDES